MICNSTKLTQYIHCDQCQDKVLRQSHRFNKFDNNIIMIIFRDYFSNKVLVYIYLNNRSQISMTDRLSKKRRQTIRTLNAIRKILDKA